MRSRVSMRVLTVAVAALAGCGGDGEPTPGQGDAATPDASIDAEPACVPQVLHVPVHGICDRPISTPANEVEYALCVEYTGADDYPYDITEQCESQGGTHYPTGRACTTGGTVGHCTKARGIADSETVYYYYPPRWTATTAQAHCTDEDGEFEAADPEICAAMCGNGVAETPGEECDDGNVATGDGCNACTTE